MWKMTLFLMRKNVKRLLKFLIYFRLIFCEESELEHGDNRIY